MTTLRRLAAILIHPRRIMREILDAPRDRMFVVVFMLAMISGAASDTSDANVSALRNMPAREQWIACAAVIAVLAISVVALFVFAWVAQVIGTRLFEGQATVRGVRSAMAWGLAPAVWALLYRLPAAIWLRGPDESTFRVGGEQLRIDPGRFSQGCAIALVFGVLELGFFVWTIVISSHTIGEAHNFSAWRGLATLVLTYATPVIVIVAALLAMA